MLIYTNLYVDKDLGRKYEDGVMSVGVKELETYARHISNDGREFDVMNNQAWIVSA